jgi:monoamine oxidase
MDNVSVYGFNKVCMDWKSGASNFFIRNMSHVDIISKAFSSVLDKIDYNIQVTNIIYSDKKVEVHALDHNSHQFDICIVTVPINALRKINFTPDLPEGHKNAISKLKMDNCGKVLLKFKSCVWPQDSSWIIIPGIINCYWSATQGKKSKHYILTGMTAGEDCRKLSKIYKENKEEFKEMIIGELAQGLKVKKSNLMDMFEDCLFFDWGDMPFIGGGYTYPLVNEGDIRATLRQSIDDKLFFAGEATAEWGHIGTIHGAIESGYRVAETISTLFKKN